MRKKKILLLQGGKNEEHEVSINTGNEVYKALLKLGYKKLLFFFLKFSNFFSTFNSSNFLTLEFFIQYKNFVKATPSSM